MNDLINCYSNGRPAAEINPEIGDHGVLFQARPGDKNIPPSAKRTHLQKIKSLIKKGLSKGLRK